MPSRHDASVSGGTSLMSENTWQRGESMDEHLTYMGCTAAASPEIQASVLVESGEPPG